MTLTPQHGDRLVFARDPANGALVGPDGCHYDTESAAVYFGALGLCGCGTPEDVHALLLDCLRQFKGGPGVGGGVDGIERLVAERSAVAAEFIAHFLDRAELLEHGTSVFGSWLTERGKQALEIGSDHGEDSP